LKSSRYEERAVTFAADLSVVDSGFCRVRDEPEAVPGALECGCGHRDGYVADLVEVTHEVVCGVMDVQEALDDTAPLDVNRINPPTRESERTVRAEAVRNRERVENCTYVLGVQLGSACVQVNPAAAFRQRSGPKDQALRDSGIPGMRLSRARRAQRVKSYEREGAMVLEAVYSNENAFHEPPVSVKCVRDAITAV
jgi:hypothetical protein